MAMIFSLTFLVVGCGKEVAVDAKSKALPKLDFHKPESFDAAIVRVREIHDAIVSSESLPKPISYTVLEVSHSHDGGNPHVHYHLDESGDHDHDHDHGHDHHDHERGHDHEHEHEHEHGHDHDDHDDHDHDHDHEDSKKHHISVDVFTELADVVRWLPKIASDGDLPQKEWKQAKALSEEMSEHLETIGTGLPTVQRTNYQSDSSSMEKWIGELESIVKSTSSMSK